MDPVLLWVVAGLSAVLLVVGGALLARVRWARVVTRARQEIGQLREAYAALESAHRAQEEQLRQAQTAAQDAASALEAAGPSDEPNGPGSFHEATVLPEPADFFQQVRQSEQAPSLDRVSPDEFEIQEAAPKGLLEETDSGLEVAAPPAEEATRQFNLHSPEAAVQFLQRIDELTEENRQLRAQLAERDEVIAGMRAEGSEQAQRFAALDAHLEKLRQEVARRGERIAQLEARLRDALQASAPTGQKEPPRTVVSVLSASRIESGAGSPPSAPEEPTLQVPRIDAADVLRDKG